MRLTVTGAAVAVCVVVALIWLVALTWLTAYHQADQIRLLQAVSVGMYREQVIENLGGPLLRRPADHYVEGGEMLIYDCWRHSMTEIYVIVDENGRVAMIVYPDVREGS